MKIMLMDTTKIINLVLPNEIFGNYWIVNTKKDNLASVKLLVVIGYLKVIVMLKFLEMVQLLMKLS